VQDQIKDAQDIQERASKLEEDFKKYTDDVGLELTPEKYQRVLH